jgi:MORN repeat variant
MSAIAQELFYRNGQIHEAIPMRNGKRHGLVRTWHKNGVLASEEPYLNGLPHGWCKQWNEAGKLLGRYKMALGTGIQRQWHQNGQLQMEVSTVKGQFCGRNRVWLWDGSLLSERFYIYGHPADAETYRAAASKDKKLQKFRGQPSTLKALGREKRIYSVFVASLLEQSKPVEARKWLQKKTGKPTARSLGAFKRERDALQFVQALYEAGARKVNLHDIYSNQAGDQFADCLLVRLPRDPGERMAVRRIGSQLRRRGLGAMQPDADIGESYLYLYFG